MRLRSIVSEAWRNITSATTGALLFAVALAIGAGFVAANDVSTIVRGINTAHNFATSGAAVTIVAGQGAIDGRSCEALNSASGIQAAGAVRSSQDTITALAMPSTNLTITEITPSLLHVIADDIADDAGVWLPEDLARTLGAEAGGHVETNRGPAAVAGVYPYPDDGRARDLAYTMVSPVPADGLFDQCWALIWPHDSEASGLLTSAIANPEADISYKQLNASLGTTLDRNALFSERPTLFSVWIAAGIGIALGYVSTRRRRLEFASNLHAGVAKSSQNLQVTLETAAWAVAGFLISLPVLGYVAWQGNAGDMWEPWIIGARSTLTASTAAVVGALIGTLQTREKHLFNYFKQR